MKIGDKVSILNDNLEGIVTSVHGDEVIFKDEHGFTYRYEKAMLVVQNASIYEHIKPVEKYSESKVSSKKHNKSHLVLDLHFDKLVKAPANYNSIERLFHQREKLLETLEFCKNNRVKKMEIIHGLGDGTVQKMVIQTLEDQTGLDFHNKDILHHQSAGIIVEFH